MAIRDCIERIKVTLSGKSAPQNEEKTKLQVIVPILDELGWDVTNRRGSGEVEYEFQVGSQKSKGRVDIALVDEQRRAICLVEAKAPSEDLDKHVEQVLNYAFHDGVTVCALTTGTLWWLYLPRERGAPSDRRFAELDLADGPAEDLSRDFLRFLSRASLTSERAEREAKRALSQRQEAARIEATLPALWEQMIGSSPDPELVELVRRRLLDTASLQASAEQVASVIAGRSGFNAPGANRDATTLRRRPADDLGSGVVRAGGPGRQVGPTRRRPSKRPMTKSIRPTAVEVMGVRIAVGSWKTLYLEVLGLLYDRHPGSFFEIAQRAYKTDRSARIHSVFSRVPSTYRAPIEIRSTGMYTESARSSDHIRSTVERLMEVFGYSKTDVAIELAE